MKARTGKSINAGDLSEIQALAANFSFEFDDAEPRQTLRIDNYRPIRFSNEPEDLSDELPGNGCGQDMRHAYPSGSEPYEPVVTAFFIWLSKRIESLHLIDIGALWGHTSFVAASMFDNATVHMFEMNPLTASILQKNLELNVRPGVSYALHNILLSDEDVSSTVTFKHYTARYGEGQGGRSISKTKILRENAKTRLRKIFGGKSRGTFMRRPMHVARLDTIFLDSNFRPDVIKIDVEGSQYKILSGAKSLIESARPLVLVEFDRPGAANDIGRTNREVVAMMGEWGFKCAWCDHRRRSGALRSIDATTSENMEVNSLGVFYPS
jgi:FkbM family methyltransferase